MKREFIFFILVGILATGIHVSVVIFLTMNLLGAATSNVFAFLVANAFSYLLMSKFCYGTHPCLLKYKSYLLSSIPSLVVVFLIGVFGEWFELKIMLTTMIILLTTPLLSFFIQRHVVWKAI
jgi:putative flippase GtrA